MDVEQSLLLHQWICTRFLGGGYLVTKVGEKAAFSALPGAEDCSLFEEIVEQMTGEKDGKETYGGHKLRLMNRLKTILRTFHLDAADYLTSTYRRIDTESGKSDLAALLYFLSFLLLFTLPDFDPRFTPFPSFHDDIFLGKSLRISLSIYVRLLGQMSTYSLVPCLHSPFQLPIHRRSESSVQKRQRYDLEAEIEDLKAQNLLLQSQILACSQAKSSPNTPNRPSYPLLDTERDEFETIQAAIAAKEAEIIKLQRENTRLNNEKTRLMDENDILTEKNADLMEFERKINGYREKAEYCDSLKAEISDLKAVLQVNQVEKSVLNEKIRELGILSSRSEYFMREISGLEEKLVDILSENTRLKDEIEMKNRENHTVTHICVRESQESDGETEELRSYVVLLEAEIATLQAKISSDSSESLKLAVIQTEQEANWLKTTKDEWLTKYAALESRTTQGNREKELEKVALQTQIAKFMEENAKMKKEIADLKRDNSKARENAEIERKIGVSFKTFSEKLTAEVTSLKETEIHLTGQICSMRKTISIFERLFTDLESLTLSLKAHIEDVPLEVLVLEIDSIVQSLRSRSDVSTEADESFHTPPSH